MTNDTKISMHLIDEIKRLSSDELDCYKRGLTEHALMIQKERHRLEIALESFKARVTLPICQYERFIQSIHIQL